MRIPPIYDKGNSDVYFSVNHPMVLFAKLPLAWEGVFGRNHPTTVGWDAHQASEWLVPHSLFSPLVDIHGYLIDFVNPMEHEIALNLNCLLLRCPVYQIFRPVTFNSSNQFRNFRNGCCTKFYYSELAKLMAISLYIIELICVPTHQWVLVWVCSCKIM